MSDLAIMGALPRVDDAKIANVASHLFYPLEQRLGNFTVNEGANKREVMNWWADMLGAYTPDALLWFANHWLRTDELGKFPRSPGQVVKILREHGHQPVVKSLPGPADALAAPLKAFREWKARNVDTYPEGKPWWCRRALEYAVSGAVRDWVLENLPAYNAAARLPYREGFSLDDDVAYALAWQAGVIQAVDAAAVRVVYTNAMDQVNAAIASPNDITRQVGKLMQTTWATEERQHGEWLQKHGGVPSE